MQLSLFNDLHVLEQDGFAIEKTFKSSNDDRFKRLESTYSVSENGKVALYVQDNGNETFNAFGFRASIFNVDMKEVLEMIKNKNNWCLDIGG